MIFNFIILLFSSTAAALGFLIAPTKRQCGVPLSRIHIWDDDRSEHSLITKLKVPIVQLIRRKEVVGEIVFTRERYDIDFQKLNAVLSSQCSSSHADVARGVDSGVNQYIVQNMYDDNMLHRSLESESLSVLKLYSMRCEMCHKLEPQYEQLASQFRQCARFYQADVENVPLYIKMTAASLAGQFSSSEQIKNCRTCQGTGIETCDECDGEGFFIRGNISVICISCGGKKQRRCSECGGRCVACG